MTRSLSSPDPDAAMLSRIAAGDEAALAEFYRLHESRVYAFAVNRLNDPHAAADIVNETMMAVWRGAGRYQGGAKVTTWLLGIARHKIVDHLRKSGRGTNEELDSETEDIDLPAVDAAIAAAQDADQVRHCMDRLSAAHRQVVHLAFFEDLSYPEVAEIVDCPEGTVKTRMFHAKQLLKKCLQRLNR